MATFERQSREGAVPNFFMSAVGSNGVEKEAGMVVDGGVKSITSARSAARTQSPPFFYTPWAQPGLGFPVQGSRI